MQNMLIENPKFQPLVVPSNLPGVKVIDDQLRDGPPSFILLVTCCTTFIVNRLIISVTIILLPVDLIRQIVDNIVCQIL